MALLLKEIIPEKPQYKDRRFPGDQDAWERRLRESTTVYVGNLAFVTREEQVYEVFNKVGMVERVIMGLHKEQKTPCGFCFVEFRRRQDAEAAVSYINRTKLDDRVIRVDMDWGFEEDRQWGRGKSGGQVRDEYRKEYDAGRGGLGVQAQYEAGMNREQKGHNKRAYSSGMPPPGPVPPSAPPPPLVPTPPPPPEEGEAGEVTDAAGADESGAYMQSPGSRRATKRARREVGDGEGMAADGDALEEEPVEAADGDENMEADAGANQDDDAGDLASHPIDVDDE